MAAPGAASSKKKAKAKEPDRVLIIGKPDETRCDNKVVTSRYTVWTFLPVAITEQFRRFANLYFLIIGFIMALGYYTPLFESAISPWTTLGPLAIVISFSLCVEGSADAKRHKNDEQTNNAPCVVLRRADELEKDEHAERDPLIIKGKDVVVDFSEYLTDSVNAGAAAAISSKKKSDEKDDGAKDGRERSRVAFQKVRRMDIRQGHLVLVKNREMVPADMVLLASCNDQGSAFIETSSIDGETNLKLRLSPTVPKSYLKHLKAGTLDAIQEDTEEDDGFRKDMEEDEGGVRTPVFDTIESATKRLTRFSYLGRPTGRPAMDHPDYKGVREPHHHSGDIHQSSSDQGASGFFNMIRQASNPSHSHANNQPGQVDQVGSHSDSYVAALTSEPPNPSVNTFMGKITLPPLRPGNPPIDVALEAENVLLRGAVLRNTEWALGVVFFTGTDTKLVQNSFKTKSKFSQLDRLMNWTVCAILFLMFCIITYLASFAFKVTNERFDELWYVGFNTDTAQKWPYLPDLPTPEWRDDSFNWVQYFLLYVTLLTNFVPLSLYVTVEIITFMMLYFIYADLDMYDNTTNTRALARSTIVSDLGRIQYIFSDKTGTLTQNVMRFKRCSVDGMVFGAPVQKARPRGGEGGAEEEDEEETTPFHPLRHLLVGRFKAPRQPGLEGLGDSATSDPIQSAGQMLTFNAEMFLRVMSLCHTVVVEKDLDNKTEIGGGDTVKSTSSSKGKLGFFNRKRTNTNESLPTVKEEDGNFEIDTTDMETGGSRARTTSVDSLPPGEDTSNQKASDGAPAGFAYQAESPDEGALVSAASKTYGFQVVSRDSSGITLQLTAPSHLQVPRVVQGFKSGTLTMQHLAAESAEEISDKQQELDPDVMEAALLRVPRKESWTILAVNKFDSDRKRMSILLRAPRELGEVPILFCKGADTSMLNNEVCSSTPWIPSNGSMAASPPRPSAIGQNDRDVSIQSVLSTLSEGTANERESDEADFEMAQLLGLQTHLGDFASEGLRTLVLGMRVLTEAECSKWMEEYKAAATSLKNRSEMLSKAASKIERNIHIVGATAIEDKLQTRVPETIATLGKAGIKLWVLTGDKRETAVEIGYSTHVLTPRMHLTEVPDNGKMHVRTQMAMEFMRLIKMGKLVEYQKTSLDGKASHSWSQKLQNLSFVIAKCLKAFRLSCASFFISFLFLFGCKTRAEERLEDLKEIKAEERAKQTPLEFRRKVRASAEKQIKRWLASDEGKKQSGHRSGRGDDDSLASEETPAIFTRASSARQMLNDLKSSGKMSSVQLREASLAQLTVLQAGEEAPLVDEDTLSMESFFPGNKDDLRGDFDKKKRTLLERLFAIDRDVRKGQLIKHVYSERLAALAERRASGTKDHTKDAATGPRAIVIEGDALKHLLGDPMMETILFSVASNCEAVIACRVSPKQKAQLLNLVRLNVKPEPITLAIGDGANDVGMIQEAHVGIGISGKEGQQAVNASDFAIAQFRFLEDLLLIHGRWNFFRQSTVILFSFYKNAVMACMLVVYADETLYSGTPIFDEWLIAILNFIAAFPIIFLGLFDRCLDKDYVRAHPEVYKATRANELITFRTVIRWVFLVIIHVFALYYFTVLQQVGGGGMTPAWQGLMSRKTSQYPGDGEGGDLKSVGTVSFTCMIILFAYKVLFESKSLIHGYWPAFTCKKGVGEGFFSRVAYTWHGVAWLSIGFYLWALSVYGSLGMIQPSTFSPFVFVPFHVLGERSLSWVLILFVPINLMGIDIIGKLFSNMFYPTQTQIHIELEQQQKASNRKRRMLRASSWRRSQASRQSRPVNPADILADNV